MQEIYKSFPIEKILQDQRLEETLTDLYIKRTEK